MPGSMTLAKAKRAKPERERIEFKAEPAWVARLERVAGRFGLSVAAYVRQAVTRQMNIDDPEPHGGRE